MKIAYLLLCHKNPEQIRMLLNQLNDSNVEFFMHIDKKSNMNCEEFYDFSNLSFVDYADRVDIQWATNSMIRATCELLRILFESKTKFDYVVLLSGQDFPIKSKEEITQFLNVNMGSNFIEILDHDDKMYSRYNKRSLLYYPNFLQKNCSVSKIFKKLYIFFSGGYFHTFSIFKRKNNKKINFEYGSQWWGLSYECLLWIYNYLNKNPEFIDFFDHSLTPDECVFQTLFMMSPYKDTRKDKLTYLEWSSNRNNPRILIEKDFCLLKKQNFLFARKFDIVIDKKIIEKLM